MKFPTYPLNPAYKEISKLAEMLSDTDIPHTIVRLFDGWQIGYPILPRDGDCVCSVIQHHISYGSEYDLLEIEGLLTPEEGHFDEVVGNLTAEDVFERIKTHWEAQNDAGTE